MKRATSTVKTIGEPLVSLEVLSAEVERAFGPPHAFEGPSYAVAGPTSFWAFEFECGLGVVLEQAAHEELAWLTVFADELSVEHVLRHLPLKTEKVRRCEQKVRGVSGAEGGVWELWRQDDHDNKMQIGSYGSEREARCKLAEFEKGRHKQTCWVLCKERRA